MRWICAPLIVIMAGCGASESDLANARDEARREAESNAANAHAADLAARDADAARIACEQEQQRLASARLTEISQAQANLRNAIGYVSNRTAGTSVAFGVRVETLEGGEWRWVEGEDVTSDFGSTRSDLFHYSVSPTALSSNVELTRVNGGPGIRFSCQSGNCIRVTGRRILNGSLVDVDEMRDDNYWALDTTNRAEVVSQALSTLIRRASESTVPRDCSAG